MSLAAGSRLGSFEIVSLIGVGGMGEVYRAKDTKLHRDIALKILPASVASDPDRLARFRREAQLLASLNHPNIAHIYGFEDAPQAHALVMEIVEGPTLADRIAQGAIPLEEALPIARQLTDALENAHEQGIVHRDLKPANIKVRDDGTVKVLDFGLAKALTTDGTNSADGMNSPTLTARATQLGMILGTAAYMAPEQARGRVVDRRADIWAFGVVLYEMLTGQRAFEGDDISITLASVLKEDVKWDALPADLPASIRRLLRRCLEKDPKRRLAAIGDARLELDEPPVAPETSRTPVPATAAPQSRLAMPVIAALFVVGILASAAVAWFLKPAPVVANVVTRFQHLLPDGQTFTRTGRHNVIISPDGSMVVYVANSQLFLRHLNQFDAQPIRGTTEDPLEPVFSPDSQWIAYFVPSTIGATNATPGNWSLRKIAVSGGAPVTLSTVADAPWGISWERGSILFGQRGGLFSLPDGGGTPQLLLKIDPTKEQLSNPRRIDERHLLVTVLGASIGGTASGVEGQVAVADLATGARTVLVNGGTDGRLLPTGQLIYIHDATLLAVPFDRSRLALNGGPVPLLEGVSETATTWSGQFSLSDNGTLAYRPGTSAGGAQRNLVWVDRQGKEQAVAAKPRAFLYPRVSPDGTRISVSSTDDENDIWIWDVPRETLTRLTFGPAIDIYGEWMPDGRRVVFRSSASAEPEVFRKQADGTGTVEPLSASGTGGEPQAISPDGLRVVLRSTNQPYALNVLDLGSVPAKPTPLVVAPKFNVMNAALSPDGRWIAYQSNESSTYEIYVRPFPAIDAGRWQVSSGGGGAPVWARSGRELFYAAGSRMMAVTVQTGGAAFGYGKPAALFDLTAYTAGVGRNFDVAPDGRFLLIKALGAETGQRPAIVVVSHFLDEVRAKVK